jgi:hypothetical protein
MTAPSVALLLGLLFVLGGAAGSAITARSFRARERDIAIKFRALDAVRRYLHERGIELAPWVADTLDQDRRGRAGAQGDVAELLKQDLPDQ